MVLFRHGQRLGAGGGIRRSRAAGDHIQRVAENVAQHDAEHLRGGARLGEPPTLHARKPLADCVHLDDICPAGQQLICDVLQFRGGEQRLLKQRTAAA